MLHRFILLLFSEPIMRVLHFLDSLEISGGVQAVVMNAYRNIDHAKLQFDFAVYDCPDENSYRQEIETLGGSVHIIGSLSQVGIRKYLKRISQVLASNHYNAVHAHNLHHNGLILWKAKSAGVPIRISHCHQSSDERNTSLTRRCFTYCLKLLLFKYATKLVACGDKAAAFLYGKRAYTFLPNAISLKPFFIACDTIAIRKSLGIDTKIKIILHIGRFCYPKNHIFDLEIMKLLGESGNFRLLLVGGGELEETLRTKIKECHLDEVVTFLGVRKDIPSLLKMADIAILPSLHEGLPMVAVEAQAAACPMLISDVVTRQADLGLGLVEYLPLEASAWQQRIECICAKPPKKPSFEQIQQRFMDTGFETSANVQRWYELYGIDKNV